MKKAFVYGCAVLAIVGTAHAASAAWTHFRWTGVPVGDNPAGFESTRLDLYLDMATFNVPGKKIGASYAELRYFKGASTTTFASVVGVAQYELSDFNGGFSYDIAPKFDLFASGGWSFFFSLIRPAGHPWTSADPQAFLDATTTPGAGLNVIVLGPHFWPGMNSLQPATVTSDVPPPLVPTTASVSALLSGFVLTARRRR